MSPKSTAIDKMLAAFAHVFCSARDRFLLIGFLSFAYCSVVVVVVVVAAIAALFPMFPRPTATAELSVAFTDVFCSDRGNSQAFPFSFFIRIQVPFFSSCCITFQFVSLLLFRCLASTQASAMKHYSFVMVERTCTPTTGGQQ